MEQKRIIMEMYEFDRVRQECGELMCFKGVYASRGGLANLTRDPNSEPTFSIQVYYGLLEWDPSRFEPEDFVVERTHHFRGYWDNTKAYNSWDWVWGAKPDFVNFGGRWCEWVNNLEVQRSAKEYLLLKAKSRWLKDRIHFLALQDNPDIIHQGWKEIALIMLDNSRCANLYSRMSFNRASLNAMPIKIALRLGGW